jgi:hypothetical protein
MRAILVAVGFLTLLLGLIQRFIPGDGGALLGALVIWFGVLAVVALAMPKRSNPDRPLSEQPNAVEFSKRWVEALYVPEMIVIGLWTGFTSIHWLTVDVGFLLAMEVVRHWSASPTPFLSGGGVQQWVLGLVRSVGTLLGGSFLGAVMRAHFR